MHALWTAIRRRLCSLKLPKAPTGQQWIVFEDGGVAFLAPAHYAMHREPDDTVAVYPPGDDGGITLRFSLHTLSLEPDMPADAAVQFVAEQAAKRGLSLTQKGDHAYLTESQEVDESDRRVLMHFWQVGRGQIVVVASATIWGIDRESETVQQTLATVPRIFQTIRRT